MSGTILVFSHTRFFPEHLIFPAENGENFFPETDHFIIQSTRIIASGTGRKREGFSGKNPFLQSRLGKEQNFPPDSPQQGRGEVHPPLPPWRAKGENAGFSSISFSASGSGIFTLRTSAFFTSLFPCYFLFKEKSPPGKGKKASAVFFSPLFTEHSSFFFIFPGCFPLPFSSASWELGGMLSLAHKIRLFIDTLLISLLRKETLLSI